MEALNILLAGAVRVDQAPINTTACKYVHLLSVSARSNLALHWKVSLRSFQSFTTLWKKKRNN